MQTVLTSSLGSSSEEVKAVASQALGGVAIGNLSTYLPFILKQIQSQVDTINLPVTLVLRPGLFSAAVLMAHSGVLTQDIACRSQSIKLRPRR